MKRISIIGLLVLWPGLILAKGVYQTPEDFLQEVLPGEEPAARVLWLTDEIQPKIVEILGHAPSSQRIRYWQRADRSVWIMDEIGKEEAITTGIVVRAGQIEEVRILIFRESRGWEVRYPFFLDQFKDVRIQENKLLDKKIDSITGATLSVRAVTRLARLALFLDSQLSPQP